MPFIMYVHFISLFMFCYINNGLNFQNYFQISYLFTFSQFLNFIYEFQFWFNFFLYN